jgi:hypothetical protein
MEARQSFTDRKGESVGTFETNQNERISTDGRSRHDFLQTLQIFDSKLKSDIVLINESTKDIIIGELTCPMEARMTYWHETKTKKYHDLASRIAEKGFAIRFFAFEVGCRGLVGKSLRKFLTALELPKKISEETLTDCAITALKCSRKIFLSRSSLNFEPSSQSKVMGPSSSWNADKRRFFEKNIYFFPNKHRLFSL